MPLGKDGAEDLLKSCRIDPESKKRNKGQDSKAGAGGKSALGKRKHVIEEDWVIELGPKGTYSISEQPGFVHIVQYVHGDAKDEPEPPATRGIEVVEEDL